MKKGLILSVMLVNVLALVYSQSTSWTVTNVTTWVEAVNGIRSGGNNKEYTIAVTGNVSVPPSAESTFGSAIGITVTIAGSGTLSPSSNGNLLVIGAGQTIIAKDVTLRGRSNNGTYSVVTISNGGIFRMEGNVSVTGNTINGNGGGVYIDGGTFTMQDNASISGNTSSSNSNISRYGTFYLFLVGGSTDSSNVSSAGGGVFINDGTFTMYSGTISGNSASSGGGVYINSGTFTMLGGTISGNANWGVYNRATFTIRGNGSITGNKGRNGGGVYNTGTFTMQGGTISDNADSGVVNTQTFTMENGIISGNVSNYRGGGVYNQGTFTMRDGIISGNTSLYGGGVFVPDGQYSGTFTMQGGTISGNTAIVYGGGVYMGGNFTMQGNASVSGNKTNYHGGGVYVIGYGYGDRPFTMKDSASVSGNTASGNGGGLYIASGRGGAPILDQSSGGIFVMQDNTSIFGNTAIGSGGGVYFNGKSFTKTGGNIYGDDAEQNYKNTAIGGRGSAVYESNNGGWRNATAGLTMNANSYGFWLNEGEAIAVKFPSSFSGVWKRDNFNNMLTLTENTVKSSSSNYVWGLIRISGDTYTMKRIDSASTITITITYRKSLSSIDGSYWPASLSVSGDSGSGQDNWNGSWNQLE